jgi:hypothetical protein
MPSFKNENEGAVGMPPQSSIYSCGMQKERFEAAQRAQMYIRPRIPN